MRTPLIRLVVICVGLVVAVGLAVGQSSDSAVARHRALVVKAENILTSPGGDAAVAREYLEQATTLAHSFKADFYLAHILCLDARSAAQGSKLLENALTDYLPSQERVERVHLELAACRAPGTQSAPAPVVLVKERVFISTVLKGVQWGQPIVILAGPNLPEASWSHVAAAREAAARATPLGQVVEMQPFMVIGQDSTYLRAIASAVLQPYYANLSKEVGVTLDGVVYVFVSRDRSDFSRSTSALYTVDPHSQQYVEHMMLAFSDPEHLTISAICGGNPSNCTSFAHELVHLLSHQRYPNAPWWLDEGLAELYESGDLQDGKFVPRSGWRLGELHWHDARDGELARLLAYSKNATEVVRPPEASTSMARARFFCMYLDSLNQLWPFYRRMRDRPWLESLDDVSGVAALEAQLGKPLQLISSDFTGWLGNKGFLAPSKKQKSAQKTTGKP